ncbi:hypothetical protein [Pyxidicoccus caerfyrddinensis]|uniref:hypothetical protein n=1 Tax=Pyxidicoccus caerfyrddinensis TaxID=2709663 RepID=UPI0013D92604|nr:hypothetical protein [Pyxidicoccus caerfyrddinensis]
MNEPRAVFATTPERLTVIVRRHDEPGAPPSHGVSVYRGYLTPHPEDLPLPGRFREDFPSRDEALEQVRREWRLEAAAFQDVRLGHSVDIDFVQALRQGTLEPLRPGMSADALVSALGVPEGITQLIEPGFVCWFYGSVQLHLRAGALQSMEIDRGMGDFTSLRLKGWFLECSTTRAQLERELTSRAVPYAEETVLGAQVLRLRGAPQQRGFIFDFDADGRIHALYWNV